MEKQTKPLAVTKLEAAYGPPSQAAFGSAVFHEAAPGDLEQAAQEKYRFFVGDLWEQYGAEAWLGPWQEVYARPSGARRDILAELQSIQDATAALSAPLLLDNDPVALAAVYDDPAMAELCVYTVGDGAAMSGLLIGGRRPASGVATFLILLMD